MNRALHSFPMANEGYHNEATKGSLGMATPATTSSSEGLNLRHSPVKRPITDF